LLAKGTTVAGYRIDGPLGEGGMGVVYRATQLSLNRSVALKILSADFGEDAAFRERFRREGLLQAAIDHPHIVTVYDTGESPHGLYLVMRMVRGPTLKDMILSRELDPGRSLRLLSQVADALDTAHDAGLTHRDVKPQNILIGARDHAYLADFGLTKAPDEAGRLTATGQFVGTIDYVSPEQIQGEPASDRSDVYALTGVLYECLVGAVPFPKPAEAAVVYAHISEPPPRPTQERPELPGAIDDVIAKGMAKDPGERYASPGELLRDAHRAFGEAVGSAPGPLTTPEETGVRGDGAPTQPAAGAASPTLEDVAQRVTTASPIVTGPTTPDAPSPAPATVPAGRGATRSRTVPILAVAAALAVVAAVAGYLLGGSGSDSESEGAALTSSASAGSLGLSFPNDWKRVAKEPKIPGLDFSEPIVLVSPDAAGARLVAGGIDGSGPTLLPESFLRRLPKAPSRDDTVKLGRLEAYRYAGLVPKGAAGRVTVYAGQTTGGVAAVACVASPALVAEFGPECERVATTLELSGAKPLPLGPSDDYAKAVSTAFKRLDTAAGAAAKRLRAADTPSAQAEAAGDLADAYTAAARALAGAPVGPYERAANSRLVGALRDLASAYSRAATAADAGDDGAYDAAGDAVKSAAADLKRAEAALRRLGYSTK
jgi:serine/threonine-protein kinase